MDAPGASIVIPTMNRRGDLERLLRSLRAQSRQDVEVIVVDNGSTDGTEKALAARGGWVTTIVNPTNLGAAAAKNQGIVASRAPLVWFLDSDTELADSHVVERALAIMAENPQIGALGGEMIRDERGNLVSHVKRFRPNGETESTAHREPLILERCDYLPTCNCVVRREILEGWGGFDPAYFILCEDDELGYAVRRAGLQVVFDSRVSVVHHVAPSGRTNSLWLVNRNRLRCSLHNMPLRQAAMLPLNELRELLQPANVQILVGDQDKRFLERYMSGRLTEAARRHPTLELVAVAAFATRYAATLAGAYLHHALRVRDIARIRRHRPDFLARIAGRAG